MPDIKDISFMTDEEIQIYSRLSEPQLLHIYEPGSGLFIAESPKVIERALNAGYEPVSVLLETKDIEGEAAGVIEKCGSIPVYTSDSDSIKELVDIKLVRGALCAMKRRALPALSEICSGKKRIAVLENVTNPTNIGAAFRSAAALGMEAVILTEECSDPLYRRSSRVSMGTVFQVPWTFARKNWLDELHDMDFRTAAMALEQDSVSIDNDRLMKEEKLAVILGNEGNGLYPETVQKSDYTVMIPMYNGVDSLNVAAASAVAFWQLGAKHLQEL